MMLKFARKTAESNKSQRKSPFARFVRDEDGSFVVLTLFLIIIAFLMIGMGLDVARQEAMRSRMQSALDRGVLAAANMSYSGNTQTMVQSYFQSAGFDPTSVSASYTLNTFNKRIVTASTGQTIDTFFMNWVNVPTLPANLLSVATESVAFIEISLVLDMSGSMNGNAAANALGPRFTNLRAAADEFVTVIFGASSATPSPNMSMSIIPYGTTVNAGPLIEHFSVTPAQATIVAQCADFDAADFATMAVPATLQRSVKFDYSTAISAQSIDNSTNPSSSQATTTTNNTWSCPVEPGNMIAPILSRPDQLHHVINNRIQAGHNQASPKRYNYTSIEIGMKWATMLLDPSARPAITAAKAGSTFGSGATAASASQITTTGRPLDYTTPATPADQRNLKVIVLMTDGENTYDWHLTSAFKIGNSPIYASSDWSTIRVALTEVTGASGSGSWNDGDPFDNELYYDPNDATTSGTTKTTVTVENRRATGNNARTVTPGTLVSTNTPVVTNYDISTWSNTLPVGVTQKTWLEVWDRYTPSYVAWRFYAQPKATHFALTDNSASPPTVYNPTTAQRNAGGASGGCVNSGSSQVCTWTATKTVTQTGTKSVPQSEITAVFEGLMGKASTSIKACIHQDATTSCTDNFGRNAGSMLVTNFSTTKDSRLLAACTAAKNAGIYVFTVGLDVGSHVANTDNPARTAPTTIMQNCATSASHYFPATVANVKSQFTTIANEIGKLRLTQ